MNFGDVKVKEIRQMLLSRRQVVCLGGILLASSWWRGANLVWGKGETREGEGIIVALEGSVWVGGRKASLGESVLEGEVIKGTPEASLVLRFRDNSVVKLKGDFEFRVEIGKSSRVWSLIKGGLLAIVTRGSRYSLATPTAVLGVRGTVLYYEVIKQKRLSGASGAVVPVMGKVPSPPPDAAEYLCLCNGHVVPSSPAKDEDKEIVSQYHASFFVYPERQGLRLVSAFLWNHTDSEILDLAKHQEQPPHDMEWIYRAWRERSGRPGSY
jgi:hypothetical protein